MMSEHRAGVDARLEKWKSPNRDRALISQ